MGFFAPWFLAGVAAVGLPVWLHLLRKHRSTPLPFSSLMFFERRMQSSVKHRRLRYLLLFALRAALIVLLALAFANPYSKHGGGAAAGGRKLVVLAIDDSFSMRRGGLLERAKRRRSRPPAGSRRATAAQVLAFDADVRTMTDATADTAALRAGIHAIDAADARGSYAELARALRSHGPDGAPARGSARLLGHAEIVAAAEFRGPLAPARACGWCRIRWRAAGAANFTVESVRAPRRVYGQGKTRVRRHHRRLRHGSRHQRPRALVLNGREIESHAVEIPAGRPRHRGIPLARSALRNEPVRGAHRLRPTACRTTTAFLLRGTRRAAPRALRARTRQYPRAAVLPRRARVVGAGRVSDGAGARGPDRQPGPGEVRLCGALRRGIRAGRVRERPASSTCTAEALSGWRWAAWARCAGACRSPVKPSAKPATSTAKASASRPRHGSMPRTRPWPGPAGGMKCVSTRRSASSPARRAWRRASATARRCCLTSRMGEGRVLVFASTFDNIANDFPLHAAFVPFVEQTARYLGRLDDGAAGYTVDAYFDMRREPRAGRRGGSAGSRRQARALARRGRPRAHHPAGPRRVLRHQASRRPPRAGGGERGPPRIGPGRPSPPRRWRCGGGQGGGTAAAAGAAGEESPARAALVVLHAGRAGAGGGGIVGGKPAPGGRREPDERVRKEAA